MKKHLANKNSKRRLTLILLVLGISMAVLSCNTPSVFQPNTPTPTIPPTFTASPTVTPSPTPTKTPTQIPTRTPTPEPAESMPSGTPVSIWNNIPILPDALAGEGLPEDHYYRYITNTSQEKVLDYYLQQLPLHNWEIDWVSPNDKGGYIIYRKNAWDFIYIYEEGDLTYIEIGLTASSPSL